jgi:hypothetical protein
VGIVKTLKQKPSKNAFFGELLLFIITMEKLGPYKMINTVNDLPCNSVLTQINPYKAATFTIHLSQLTTHYDHLDTKRL